MLATLKEVLQAAEDKKIAIGAFDTPNLESLCAAIAAAEEVELPTIIMHAQCHESLCPLDVIGPIMVEHAKKAKVPVCVMLDHGEDLDYLWKWDSQQSCMMDLQLHTRKMLRLPAKL